MKHYSIGQKLTWRTQEFDGTVDIPCTVTQVADDHVIAESENETLWLDEDTEQDFFERD